MSVNFGNRRKQWYQDNVVYATKLLTTYLGNKYKLHPVVSTMMPRAISTFKLKEYVFDWIHDIKNTRMKGEAGFQISINSTDEKERREMFSGNAHSLSEISRVMRMVFHLNGGYLSGRKITLNFAVADWEINPDVLLRHFSPDKYIIKLTPMHKTVKAIENGVETQGEYDTIYPYETHEEELKKAGYDVLVFVASKEEDLGRITCGNAILSGTMPTVKHEEIL